MLCIAMVSENTLIVYRQIPAPQRFMVSDHDPKATPKPSYLPNSISYAPSQSEAAKLSCLSSQESIQKSHDFFKAKAKELDEIWTKCQVERIYKTNKPEISEEQLKEDMKLFIESYLKVCTSISRLEEYCPVKLDDDNIAEDFKTISLRSQKITIDTVEAFFKREFGQYESDNIFNFSLNTLHKMYEDGHKEAALRIWEYAYRNSGDKKTWLLIPNSICQKAKEKNQEKIDKFNKKAAQKGFEYIGAGDVGMVYAVEDENGNKAALKVSIYPEDSDAGTALAHQEEQTAKLETITKTSPISYYLPKLLVDSDGNKLGVPGRVVVFKHLSRNEFYTVNPNKDKQGAKHADRIDHLNPDYRSMGLDKQFVVDFIDMYMKACQEGIDTHDIRPGNSFYNGPAYELVEIGGLDSEESKELIKLKKEQPEAFLLYTLMESFYMVGVEGKRTFSPRRFSLMQEPELLSEPKMPIQDLRQRVKELITTRLGKMTESLEESVEQGVLSYKQIMKGIQDLQRINNDRENTPPMIFLAFDKDDSSSVYNGKEVLEMLENYFKDKVGMKKLGRTISKGFRNMRLRMSSCFNS